MATSDEKLEMNVLCVDDDPASMRLISLLLEPRVSRVLTARNGREGFELYLQEKPDLVITDIMMPVMTGLSMVRHIRELDKNVGIIVTTAFDSTDFLVESIDLSVNQFVIKPIKGERLFAAVDRCYRTVMAERALRGQIERVSMLSRALEESPAAVAIIGTHGTIEYVNQKLSKLTGWSSDDLVGMNIRSAAGLKEWLRFYDAAIAGDGWQEEMRFPRKSGDTFWGKAKLSPFSAGNEGCKYILMIEDITDYKRYEQELQYLATHDTLTGLYNRGFFEEELNRLAQGRHFPVSIIVADIDGLKEINDRWGHAAGDDHIKAAARILAESFRAGDVVARTGGDEFAVIVPGADSDTMMDVLKRNLQTQVPVDDPDRRPVRLSLGAATATSGEEIADLQKRADALMYRDKLRKKGSRSAVTAADSSSVPCS